MIECTEEYIWKKRRKRKAKKFVFLFWFVLIFLINFVVNKYVFVGQVIQVCQEKCYSICTKSVNQAVLEEVSGLTYDTLISILKDESGEIKLINTNAEQINKITRQIEAKTEVIMSGIIENGIPIPAFSFTGISFLSGYGRLVNFKALSVSSVSCEFSSKFLSSGINQTLHSLYLTLTCKVSVLFPFDKREITYNSQVLISEAVLVGKVPEVYLNK